MTNPDMRLAVLWALDEPPMRDPVFEAAVSLKMERRRWLRAGLDAVGVALAAAVVGWAAWPYVLGVLDRTAPIVAVAAVLGLAVWWMDRTFERWVFGGYEDFTRDFASE
jgi:hypothetical protein